jgi:NADP-dependent 3-hydroxy acid dehydrogenase YdfG
MTSARRSLRYYPRTIAGSTPSASRSRADVHIRKILHANRERRIALISGANKGIGFEIARQLRQAGIRILIGARDQNRGQPAVADLRSERVTARFVHIDLTELATITGTADDLEAQQGTRRRAWR